MTKMAEAELTTKKNDRNRSNNKEEWLKGNRQQKILKQKK